MRQNLRADKKINSATLHDIKLELDVRCQKRIESILAKAGRHITVLGEEDIAGDPQASDRWVVDPIDGTVNFSYGIPHACVSIALQKKRVGKPLPARPDRYSDNYQTVLGVVYDPFCDELFTAIDQGPALLNGKPIRASKRRLLGEAIISVGFAKDAQSLARVLPTFNQLIRRVRKIRMMGAAALGIVYVAAGRMDAYVEFGLRLWDIAAAGFILERAGGDFWRQAVPGDFRYRILANNGPMRRPLAKFTR
jgi:myo-inositol-1(or 4)-monophosphatase